MSTIRSTKNNLFLNLNAYFFHFAVKIINSLNSTLIIVYFTN